MAEMNKLIESDSPSLKLKLSPCTKDLNRMKLKMKLVEHMKYYQGIGLSANQIGIMERAFVMYSDVKKKDNQAVGVFLLIFAIIILLGVLNG